MLKIIAGSAIAALFVLAAPNAASAASADKSPIAGRDQQATEFSDQRRRYVVRRGFYGPRVWGPRRVAWGPRRVWRPRYVRPYPYRYSYAAWGAPAWGPAWGYRPIYRPWGYRPFYRPGPFISIGFGPGFGFWF